MKIESGHAMPPVRSEGSHGQGFDALMARMEKELWVRAPGGVTAAEVLPGRTEPDASRRSHGVPSAATAVTAGPMALVPPTPGAPGVVAPAVPAGAHATLVPEHGRRKPFPMVPMLAPVPPPARIGSHAPLPVPTSERTASIVPVPAQQRLFGPSPGRVRLHWHATGGVIVRLQLPVVGDDDAKAAVVQAMLDHLRSRGVRIHEVTVNGHSYPNPAVLESHLAH